MSNWLEDYGFSAVSEEEIEFAKKPKEQPKVVEKDDLSAFEERVEKKLDKLIHLEKKVDRALAMLTDSEAAVEERKQFAHVKADEKVQAIANILIPLLETLKRTANQEYIKWPNRGPIIQEKLDEVNAILKGE